MCRKCAEVKSDRNLKKFKKKAYRENHVVSCSANYFDIKFVKEWTDLAIEEARIIDEILTSSDEDEKESSVTSKDDSGLGYSDHSDQSSEVSPVQRPPSIRVRSFAATSSRNNMG